MSKKTALALAAAIAIALPTTAFGQIGIGARVGTLGLGGDVSFGIGSRLGIRAGLGVMPDDIEITLDDIDYTLNPPSNIWNIGVDFYPFGGGFRLSGGIVNRKNFELRAVRTGETEIGDNTYNGTITIDGSLGNERETAPYVAIGFGKVHSNGFGLYVDLGAAQMGDPDIRLTGTCVVNGTQPCPSENGQTFQQTLDEEAQQAEEDAGTYVKWHPILQVGLKIGF
jgi:hypothetical protein